MIRRIRYEHESIGCFDSSSWNDSSICTRQEIEQEIGHEEKNCESNDNSLIRIFIKNIILKDIIGGVVLALIICVALVKIMCVALAIIICVTLAQNLLLSARCYCYSAVTNISDLKILLTTGPQSRIWYVIAIGRFAAYVARNDTTDGLLLKSMVAIALIIGHMIKQM